MRSTSSSDGPNRSSIGDSIHQNQLIISRSLIIILRFELVF